MIIKVNFGNEDSPLPSDEFILDFGREYSSTQGFGWITQDSLDDAVAVPIDISPNTRDREAIEDQSLDTLIHLQYPPQFPGLPGLEPPVKTPSAWEYDLENGTYQITISVGDPEFTDSNHVINLEGENAISGFVPTSDNLFTEVTTVVEVTDGQLTVDAIGGENTKLNFIEIEPVEVDNSTPDAGDGADIPEDSVEDGLTPDAGGGADADDGADIPEDSVEDDSTPDDGGGADADDGADIPEDSVEDDSTPDDGDDADADDGADVPEDSVGDDSTPDAGDGADAGDDADIPEDSVEDGLTPDDGDSDGAGDGADTPEDSVEDDSTPDAGGGADADDGADIPEDSVEDGLTPDDGDSDGAGDDADTPEDSVEDGLTPDDGDSADIPEDSVEDDSTPDDGDGADIPEDSVEDGLTPDDGDGADIPEDSVEDDSTPDDGDGADIPEDSVEDGLTPDAGDGADAGDIDDSVVPDENGDAEVDIPVEGGGVVEIIVEPIDAGINFDFGLPGVNTQSEFIKDVGLAYDADRGFGWVTQESAGSENLTPIDVVVNGRDRDTLFSDEQGGLFEAPVRDSLIHMQYPTRAGVFNPTAELTPAAWELDLANGLYEVTVGVGDSEFFDSNHVINVEGESLIAGFTPEGSEVNGNVPVGAEAFTEATATVEVNDGRLTVDAIGGENTKINYISIVAADTL